jgi:hypothetical protein
MLTVSGKKGKAMRRVNHVTASALMMASAAITVVGMSALPASAQVTNYSVPAHTAHCSGDVCAQVLSVGSSDKIRVWANTRTFTGHFELQPPNGTVHNSSDATWKAGGTGNTFTGIENSPTGNYTATAWEGSKQGGYTNIGRVTFTQGS